MMCQFNSLFKNLQIFLQDTGYDGTLQIVLGTQVEYTIYRYYLSVSFCKVPDTNSSSQLEIQSFSSETQIWNTSINRTDCLFRQCYVFLWKQRNDIECFMSKENLTCNTYAPDLHRLLIRCADTIGFRWIDFSLFYVKFNSILFHSNCFTFIFMGIMRF